MVTLLLPTCDTELLKQRLYDDYHIEVPLGGGDGRQSLRVSIEGYNARSDVDGLVRALKELLS